MYISLMDLRILVRYYWYSLFNNNMKYFVHILRVTLVLAVMFGVQGRQVQAEPARSIPRSDKAVCIGIGEYSDNDPLRWSETDAVAIATALRKNGYDVICLTRSAANIATVRRAMAVQPMLVYFAGHSRDGNLLLSDGSLPVSQIAQQTRVMLLDCCYVGSDLKKQGNTVVFAASNDYAFESSGNGLFTRHVLDWIQSDRKKNGSTLVSYVSSRVTAETGGWQRPVVGRL